MHFINILQNIDGFERVNKPYEVISEVEATDLMKIQVYASIGKSQGLISGRIFIDAKYIWLSGSPIVIMSSEGNDQERLEFLNTNT